MVILTTVCIHHQVLIVTFDQAAHNSPYFLFSPLQTQSLNTLPSPRLPLTACPGLWSSASQQGWCSSWVLSCCGSVNPNATAPLEVWSPPRPWPPYSARPHGYQPAPPAGTKTAWATTWPSSSSSSWPREAAVWWSLKSTQRSTQTSTHTHTHTWMEKCTNTSISTTNVSCHCTDRPSCLQCWVSSHHLPSTCPVLLSS